MSHDWKDANVFVTGATGLVGSWLVKKLLARGARVVALVRDVDPQSELYRSHAIDEVRVVNGALEDYPTLERALNEYDIDTVFHLGAQALVPAAHRSPLGTFESNIRGTYHLLEACRVHQGLVRRVVVASSDKAYGEQAETYREDMTLKAGRPYEVSKACGELLAKAYFETYRLPLAVARCGNIYGGGDLNWSRIVPGTIRSLLAHDRPVIRSDGQMVRDYFYVEDACEAYLALAEQLDRSEVAGEAFNFSMESPINVLGLVSIIQRLMGCEALEPIILNQAEGELAAQALSARKARELLNWRPRWSLEEGLAETIEWYRAFLVAAEAGR